MQFTIDVVTSLRDIGLEWIEDPLLPFDLEGRIRLKKSISWARIADGNFIFDTAEIIRFINSGAIDIIQPGTTWSRGLSATVKIVQA